MYVGRDLHFLVQTKIVRGEKQPYELVRYGLGTEYEKVSYRLVERRPLPLAVLAFKRLNGARRYAILSHQVCAPD
jgi:hypothetical protein